MKSFAPPPLQNSSFLKSVWHYFSEIWLPLNYKNKEAHQLVGLCKTLYATNRYAMLSRFLDVLFRDLMESWENLVTSAVLVEIGIGHLSDWCVADGCQLEPIFGVKKQKCPMDHTIENEAHESPFSFKTLNLFKFFRTVIEKSRRDPNREKSWPKMNKLMQFAADQKFCWRHFRCGKRYIRVLRLCKFGCY